MTTLESLGLAGKVVDLTKLHRYDYFPGWTTMVYCPGEELQESNRVKTMQFGQFLTKMTLMATPESVGLAGKVVDLEKVHRYRSFPDWTTMAYCPREELQESNSVKTIVFYC